MAALRDSEHMRRGSSMKQLPSPAGRSGLDASHSVMSVASRDDDHDSHLLRDSSNSNMQQQMRETLHRLSGKGPSKSTRLVFMVGLAVVQVRSITLTLLLA
jgi:hypothetical protein